MTLAYSTLKFLSTPILHSLYRHEIIGLENIPQGPVIIASNHLAFCDSVFIPLALDRPINFLAKSDYFTTSGVKGRAMAKFFTSMGQLPMDRSGGVKSQESLARGLRVLESGGILGIYPEGTRSPDGRGYRPKVGVARLALESGVSVVPVGQIGTDLVQPLGTNRPHLHNRGQKITIRTIFGKPLDFSSRSHEAHLFSVQREIADRVGVAIRELSGQEYVDVYADAVNKLMASDSLTAEQAVNRLCAECP